MSTMSSLPPLTFNYNTAENDSQFHLLLPSFVPLTELH